MRQKITYLITVLAIATVTTAYAADDGFYVGIDAGRDASTIKTNANASSPATNLTSESSLNGFLGGIHGGYNQLLTKRFVLGGELFWNNSNASTTNTDSIGAEGYRKLAITNSMGASVLPGWQLDSNNRLYARLGWILSQFSNTTTYQSRGTYGPTFDHDYRNGLEVGLGYLYSFAKQWDMRVEYDHADYNTLYKSLSGGGDNGYYSYKPESDRFILGVDYNFGLAQNNTADFHNWYIGAATGRADATIKYKSVALDGSGNAQTNQSLQGYLGELHLGYDWQLSTHSVLGAEIFGAFNSTDSSSNAVAASSYATGKWREKNSEGMALLPGYQTNSGNLLYGRIGYIASKFAVSTTGNIPSAAINFKTTRPGLQLGLGYSVALKAAWALFGEYDYAKYASIHTATTADNYYMNPTDNQYKVGVDYHF